MRRIQSNINIVNAIKHTATLYKANLVGNTFLYVFENKAIEVLFREKDFLHLTGVDTILSVNDFYKEAIRGTLQHNQIYFSRRIHILFV